MASPLGKLTAVLGLDAREFTSGIGSAQKTIGGFGVSTKTAMGIVGGAAALGFGIATKGALEAEAAQGKFMAATGATREEAKKFVSSMDALAGTSGAVGKSFEEIASVGITVSQQFKVTGDEARNLTDDILKFSKVTGQDAAGAAAQLEDTLSAFGMEADDAAGFMDQLVASNQKFGTDAGPATLGILQSMAPALQAMGMGIDDGVALLNAFEVAGVDAAGAQRGLNSAITNLPPGTSMEDFLQHLQDLRNQGIDPTAEAIEVFGNKAGAALALTIKPGGRALDDFRVSAGDVAGTVDKASEDMLTLSDRIKGWADKALAGAREIGNDFGPAITGAASLASLSAPIIKAFGGLSSFAPLKTAVESAGSKLGDLAGGRFGIAFKLAAVVGIAAIASELDEPISKIGTDLGRKFFGAFGEESKGLAHGTLLDTIGDSLHDLWFQLGQSDPLASEANKAYSRIVYNAAQKGIDPAPLVAEFDKLIAEGIDPKTAEAKVMAGFARLGGAATTGFAGGLDFIGPLTEAQLDALPPAAAAAEEGGEKVAVNFVSGFGQGVDDGLASMPIAPFSETRVYAAMLADARALGEGVPGEIGQGMQNEAHQLISGADALRDILENGLSPDSLATEAMGRDYIKLIRQGMDSEKFGAVETAQQVAIAAIDAIENAGKGTEGKGLKRIGQLYVELLNSGMTAMQARAALAAGGVAGATIDGLEGKYPALVTTGETMANKVRNGFTSKPWSTWGWNAGDAWIDGVKQALRDGDQSLQNTLRNVVGPMIAYSPPRVGPLREIDKWGLNIGETWLGSVVTGIATGAGKVRTSLGSVAAALGATLGTPRGGLALATARVASLGVNAPGLAMAGGAGGEVHIHIGTLIANDAGLDELQRRLNTRLRLTSRTGSRL